MTRLALLAAGAAGLTVLAITPAHAHADAAVLPGGHSEAVTSCGNSRLQAGLTTRLCAEVTGTTVELYGTVALALLALQGQPAARRTRAVHDPHLGGRRRQHAAIAGQDDHFHFGEP